MILVFGGTTEGRRAVEVLEEAGRTFFYSTKTAGQDITLHHGVRLVGAMDDGAMLTFCRERAIRLIVDAAHPFASQLHHTVVRVADSLNIPAIRYERIYPPRDPDITWIDDYSQVPHDIRSLLATTGVQSIARLKPLEARGVRLFYRILPRESSIALARQQGATAGQLCFFEDGGDIDVEAEAILMKESGLTGGFREKVEAARKRGMRIVVLKHPPMPWGMNVVNGPYGLRRMVERLLPEFYPLHSGLTTGTCATAAAVAAVLQLLTGKTPGEVPVVLPDGETIHVSVFYGDGYAGCVKNAGDDPDVTNGVEVRASVECVASPCPCRDKAAGRQALPEKGGEGGDMGVTILGGDGVGIFTLPGFDYPPGSPAINRVPREMMEHNLRTVLSPITPHLSHLTVTISIPQGAELARHTFNPRLGIEGGISIIGVSGIVKPYSEDAFIDSILKCMTVAKASGTECVVINSGGKSEHYVKARYPDLPQQAFVEYGNYVGETLRIAHELGFRQVVLGVMLGKAVKLAAGHLDTHSRKSLMEKDFMRQMLDEAHCHIDISDITLAREVWGRLPVEKRRAFARTVIRHCAKHCKPLLPDGSLTILLIDDEGQIYEGRTDIP